MSNIFQYPNGEAVHPVIKNFEDFQKIQNYVGSGLTAKEIVAKISKLQETGGYSSLTSKIKGVCKLNCMPFPQLDQRPCEFFYNLTFLKLHRIFFKLLLKNRKQKLSLKTHLLLQTKEL